jgi:hypothetical protein
MRERRRAYYAATLLTPRVGSADTPLDRGWGPGPAAAQLPRSETPLWLPTAAALRSCVRCRPRPRVRLHVRSTSPRGDPARRPSKSRWTDGTTDPRRVPAASGEAPGGGKGSLYTSWPASPTRSGAGAWPSTSMSAAGRSQQERTYIVVYAATSTPYAQDRTSRTLSCRAPQLRPLPATTPTSARGPVFVFS